MIDYTNSRSSIEGMETQNNLRYNILHIEDDISYQNFIKESLENFHFKVCSVDNFDLAKNELDSKQFDAIILEYKLKENTKTGLEFLEEVRAYNQNITVVFLTNVVDQEIIIKAIRLNVDDFIPKPTNVNTLPDLMIKRIEKRKKLFNVAVVENEPKTNLKGNLFNNFLILKGSIPLVVFGNWNDESTNHRDGNQPLSDSEFLMSGFLSAIQNFSSNYFGQTVDEISLANSKLVLISKNEFTACLKIENSLYKSMYNLQNKRILINTLEKILGEVISFSSNRNDITLSDSTKNHINHILTESSIITQIRPKINQDNDKKLKSSYLKRLKESFKGRKKN